MFALHIWLGILLQFQRNHPRGVSDSVVRLLVVLVLLGPGVVLLGLVPFGCVLELLEVWMLVVILLVALS